MERRGGVDDRSRNLPQGSILAYPILTDYMQFTFMFIMGIKGRGVNEDKL